MAVFDVRVAVGDTPSRRLRVQASALTLGRSRGCQVQLPSREVSGAHLRIEARGGDGLWVEDLGSANGTWIGPRRLSPGRPEPLEAHDTLLVGPYAVSVRQESEDDGEEEPGAPDANPRGDQGGAGPEPGHREPATATLALGLVRDLLSAEAMPLATVQARTPAGQEHSLHLSVGQRVRVGRDPSCELCVNDPDLSREHAEVRLDEQGVTIRDLGSKNGVLRGQERAHGTIRWQHGETLQLGGTLLRLHDPAEAWLREMEGDSGHGGLAAPEGDSASEAGDLAEGSGLGQSPSGRNAGGSSTTDPGTSDRSHPATRAAAAGVELPTKDDRGAQADGREQARAGWIVLAVGGALLVMAAAAWGLVRLLA